MHAITRSGWIEVVSGSMFSGKTEELLRRLRRAEIAEQSVAVYKPAIDDRYGEATIGTHNGRQWEATVVDAEGDGPLAIVDDAGDAAVVAIDEANFFSPALVDACNALADRGARVIVTGTDQTFRGEPFEPLPRLMAVAEYVDKLRAICSCCGEPATRNQRLIGGEPAHVDDPTILVGAEESYEARCRDCHVLRTGERGGDDRRRERPDAGQSSAGTGQSSADVDQSSSGGGGSSPDAS
ncbi:thymidine kinase [Halorubrum sp. JWXQ-INN 858]|uniref:thymidine kinase n=1 Tax=Halorubrum sp. JWXQ-INN 858 TaxID=2690782 RepID=UPI00135CE456|nr:thymidine kinase [Halorubrum sp. JWXQ-INN 858]MWV64132.1 thymidine kinase [Halorubrum sp. JWXQ-INN 858]